ncbi:MAG TPA: lysine 5,6-aminomutase subunit alpha [Candidatus Nanopelagicales bacterium]|nr:lysine 5,6-aminomutase subunit alpha [Candidatus Nanopelagicales bacterium]
MSKPTGSPAQRLEAVLRRAEDLAGAWGARARASTTPARERAVLRLLGVGGLDRDGVPLASAVVERHVNGSADRLAAGISLPFAVALLEYDVSPQQLALDVASGAIDLAFEAELLAEPDRRAAAEAAATRIAGRALERIDANRTARLELLDVLGDAPRPWFGLSLAAPTMEVAPDDAAALVAAGADLVRIRVPAGRELVLRLHDRGLEPEYWHPRESRPTDDDEDPASVPAGSQRALTALRTRVDEAAAEAGRYVRLGTAATALAAPEQALVAALERIDVVEADPIAEIVTDGVDPDRALADHAFGHRILRRSGAIVLVGPGPLIVAPDLARGLPADAGTRAGRAFAMQALAVALARGDGIGSGQLAAGALVPWLADERQPAAQALAAVALRRLAWPDLGLVFEEPDLPSRARARWPYLVHLALGVAGPGAIVLRRATEHDAAVHAEETTRAAALLAAEIAEGPAAVLMRPAVLDRAEALLAAAETTLTELADEGWEAVLGAPIDGPEHDRLGADGVVERTETFDPLDGPAPG